jgi:HSP20 family protein
MCKVKSSLYCMKSVVVDRPDGAVPEARWAPNTDVFLTEEGLVVMVELAGLRREDLEIAVESNRVMISGQRPDCARGPGCRFLMMEINYGHFETAIDLPAGYDLARARASYQNGFLRVEIPQLAAVADGTAASAAQ